MSVRWQEPREGEGNEPNTVRFAPGDVLLQVACVAVHDKDEKDKRVRIKWGLLTR